MTKVTAHPLVMRILSFDDQGRPDVVQIGYEDTTFDLREGSREFRVIQYVDPDGENPFRADPEKVGKIPLGAKRNV